MQSSSYIRFSCDSGSGDGAVMMIGGGGNVSFRADHRIGIKEANSAWFGGEELSCTYDSGSDAYNIPQSTYPLNLSVR